MKNRILGLVMLGMVLTPMLFKPSGLVAQEPPKKEVRIEPNIQLFIPEDAEVYTWEHDGEVVSDTSIVLADDEGEISIAVFQNQGELLLGDWVDQNKTERFQNVTDYEVLDRIGAITFNHSLWGRTITRILFQGADGSIISLSHDEFPGSELESQFMNILRSLVIDGRFSSQQYSDMFVAPSLPEAGFNFQSQYTEASSVAYFLPWKSGTSHTVTQGWGGQVSHFCPGTGCYAYDFGMSEGTEVRAVASGTVTHVKSNSSKCGGMNNIHDANYIVVRHDDGTSTVHLHLRDVYVTSGNVSQGQALGTAGKTGWTYCNSHLHFQRQQASSSYYSQSMPIYFAEYPGQELVAGHSYRSQNSGEAALNCGASTVTIAGKTYNNTLFRCSAGSELSTVSTEFSNSAVFLSAGTRVKLLAGTKVHNMTGSESIFRASVF